MKRFMTTDDLGPMIEATKETFKILIGENINTGESIKIGDVFPVFDITAIVAFSGVIEGAIALAFPKETAKKVVTKIIEKEAIKLEVIADGIGQLTTAVAQASQKHFRPLRMEISIPSVTFGKDHTLFRVGKKSPTVVSFSSGLGNFGLAVSFE